MPVEPDAGAIAVQDQFLNDIGYQAARGRRFLSQESEKIAPSNPQPIASTQEDVLEEALRITSGDRQSQYGPPEQDFTRTAALWNALFAHKLQEPLEARDVAMAMICLKLSRETHQRKRDNSVDIAGYARLLHIVNQATA